VRQGLLARQKNARRAGEKLALFEKLKARGGFAGEDRAVLHGRADATDVCCDGEVISESTMLGKPGYEIDLALDAAATCRPEPPVAVGSARSRRFAD
jgi:hypothetical protein